MGTLKKPPYNEKPRYDIIPKYENIFFKKGVAIYNQMANVLSDKLKSH